MVRSGVIDMRKESNFKRQQEVLNSPFDIDTHKKTFVSYLEVIIDENGEIFYAVPSHTHKLCEIYMSRFGINDYEKTKKEIAEDAWAVSLDMCEYLCAKTGCIAVWFQGYRGEPNQKQLNKLKTLRLSGVYMGPVHDINIEKRKELEMWMKQIQQGSDYK